MKTALVHDWMNQIGGAEDVLEALVEMCPDAPIYTSLYWADKMPAHWQEWNIQTSFIDKIPGARKYHQPFLPLYPVAFEQFDFSEFDLVVTNKSGFCHGIKTGPDGAHAYFVHSFHLEPSDEADVVAYADYGGPVTALVAKDNIVATQFHPEKSQTLGLALIANFLSWAP